MTNASVIASGPQRGLGLSWIVYGLARILLAVWLLSFEVTATLMFGATLSRVPNPFSLMNAFHLFYVGLILLSVVCGLLGIVAGFALLSNWSSGRMVALLAGFLSLPEAPLGLILGVYTIAKLLPRAVAPETLATRERLATHEAVPA
jgi:hypothetical protein